MNISSYWIILYNYASGCSCCSICFDLGTETQTARAGVGNFGLNDPA
jgi:hypothetical protein